MRFIDEEDMFALILLIIFGLGVAFFATQNTGLVHIVIANYLITGVPLYIIVVGSLLLGVFISWLVSLVDWLSSTIALRWKDAQTNRSDKRMQELQQQVYDLEVENARLKGEKETEEIQHEEKEPMLQPSFFHRVKHSF